MEKDFPKRRALTDESAVGEKVLADQIKKSRKPGDRNGELTSNGDQLTTEEMRARLKTYEELVSNMNGSSKDLDFAQRMIEKYRNEIRFREENGR